MPAEMSEVSHHPDVTFTALLDVSLMTSQHIASVLCDVKRPCLQMSCLSEVSEDVDCPSMR